MTGQQEVDTIRLLDGLGVRRHEAIDVDGVQVEATLEPEDGVQLAESLAELSANGLSALIRGGGSRMTLGNPPHSADVLLSTAALTGVDEFDSEDGVLHARAGTPLSSIRERIDGEGWELPIDAPGERATLGGAVATAVNGPRRHGFGPVRNWILGLEVALSSGESTRCGGRVVKNVTGYDLAKLYAGSLGTLGVIEGVWLRLRPKPEATRLFWADVEPGSRGFAHLREASLRTSTRCVALLCPRAARACAGSSRETDSSNWYILLELAGDGPAVERDAGWWCQSIPNAVDIDPDAIERLRALQGSVLQTGGLRAQAIMLPSQLHGASNALTGSVAAQIIYPGSLYAYSEAGRENLETVANACAGVIRAQKGSPGFLVLEDLPALAKDGRDVFGEPRPEWRLMKSLKKRFDPNGVLNPGRFLGGI